MAAHKFSFEPNTPLGNAEERSARALEFIAHNLEAIEGHLAVLAKNSETPGLALMRLVSEVQQVRVKLR